MLGAVFTVWAYTSFEATLLHVSSSRTRWMLGAVMLVGLFMNAAIGQAFGSAGWAFVLPFLLIQVGRSASTIATTPTRMLREHYVVMLTWIIASAPFWLIGAAVDSGPRLLWWAIAAAFDLVGTWFAHPLPGRVLHSEHVEFDAEHMVERCRLFLIIALGETMLTTGTAIAHAPRNAMTVLTGTSAFAAAAALWALYFAGSDHLVNRHVETTSDPILAARLALNGEIVVVAGLIALAVGNELVIGHPHGRAAPSLVLLLFGGPFLYLLVQTWYLRIATHVLSTRRLGGLGALILAGAVSLWLPPFTAIVVAAAVLVMLVLLVVHHNRRFTPQLGKARAGAAP
jgi:low temperature requirement protein LtrA